MYNLTTRRFFGVTLIKDLQMPFELKFVTNHSVIIIELCAVDMCCMGFYILNIQQATLNYYPGTCRILLSEPLFELESIPHQLQYTLSTLDTILPIPCILSKIPEMQQIKLKIEQISYDPNALLTLISKFHKQPTFTRDIYYLIVVYQDYFYEQHYLLSNTVTQLSVPDKSHLFLVVESTYEHISDLIKQEFHVLLGWCALSPDVKQNKLIQSKTPFPFQAHPLQDSFAVNIKYLYEDVVAPSSPILRKRTIKKRPSLEPVKEGLILDKNIEIESIPIKAVDAQLDSPPQQPPVVNKILPSYHYDLQQDEPLETLIHASTSSTVDSKPLQVLNDEMQEPNDVKSEESQDLTSIIDISKTGYNTILINDNMITHASLSLELPSDDSVVVNIPFFGLVILNNKFQYSVNNACTFSMPIINNNLYLVVVELSPTFVILQKIEFLVNLEKPSQIIINSNIKISIGNKCSILTDVTSLKKSDSRIQIGNSDLIDLDQLINIPIITTQDIIQAQRMNNSYEMIGFHKYNTNIHVNGEQGISNLKNIINGDSLEFEGDAPIYCKPLYNINNGESEFITMKGFHISVSDLKYHFNLTPFIDKISVVDVIMTDMDTLSVNGQFDGHIFYKINVVKPFLVKLHKNVFNNKCSVITTVVLGTQGITLYIIKLSRVISMQIEPTQLYKKEPIYVKDQIIELDKVKLENMTCKIPMILTPLEYVTIELSLKVEKCKVFEIKEKLQKKVFYQLI